MSRDSSATYIHMSASRNADLFEEFCRPPSSTTGFPGLAGNNSTHPHHAGAPHHPYTHPHQQQQPANGSADGAGMAQLPGHFMPFEEIALPPHLMPMNPEDEDGVVPDMHAAFGINRALGQNQGGGGIGGGGGGGGSGGPGGVGGSGGAVEPGGEASNAGVQRAPAWRDLGLTALVADVRIGSAVGARPPPRREGKRTGVLLLR